MQKIFVSFLFLVVMACSQKEKTACDLILHNGTIYTVDSAFQVCEAIAIQNGTVYAVGKNKDILAHYTAPEIIDLENKAVYPGLIDAHCHFLTYGLGLGRIDLRGTTSYEEVFSRVMLSTRSSVKGSDSGPEHLSPSNNNNSWVLGRGWDQNDWVKKEMPDLARLDSLFPHRPVMLSRIDGHAALVNSEALRQAGITLNTKIEGGEILKKNGRLSGILIDNAVDLVKQIIPETSKGEKTEALLNAQSHCFAAGLTTVDDAGLMKNEVDLIDQLQKEGLLKMRIYAMLSDSAPNYAHYLETGPYKTSRLNVRSFKFYVDGALGSRGACLVDDYSDQPGWRGFLLSPVSHFEKYAAILDKKGFQMNAHCIGDSALSVMIRIYALYCNEGNNHRWRIEHAQVVRNEDLKEFSADVIPSVQPTHATSDMYWVRERLGDVRAQRAYAYRRLLKACGLIALGTDFPVEDISPFKTFYAAVARKDLKGIPAEGFQMENSLSREQTLKGMTIWAAYSNFEEKEKGSLEKGKMADFIITDLDMMKCESEKIPGIKVLATYLNGEIVYRTKPGERSLK